MFSQDYSIHLYFSQQALWLRKAPLLGQLDLELTERCNNACIHCCINLPSNDLDATNRELTTDQWKEILRQAADLGALTVRFTGGEPLLRKDFADLYLFTRRLGMKVLLFTNARLITPELAELFARVPPLGKIEVTAYGMRTESYDAAACAPGGYFEFRRGLQYLLDRQVPFIVKSALLPSNKIELDEFETWAATIPGMSGPPSYSMFFDLRSRRDSASRNRAIARVRVSPEEGLAILTRNASNYRAEMRQFCTRFIGPPGDALFSCGAGKNGCVDAYGLYRPCMLLYSPDFSVNTRSVSLHDALVNVFPRLKDLKATNPVYLERCARCFLHGLCEQCPAKSWMEHGTLDTPVEYLCQVAHAQARYLGLLKDCEQAWEVLDWRARLALMQEENTR